MPSLVVLLKGGHGERNSYVFFMELKSPKYRLCSALATLARLIPNMFSCSLISKLGFCQCRMFIEVSPGVIYVSVILSIELIFQ